jgi:hypothetical protein
VKSNRYRKIGTETMAPPAPINPKTAPIKAPEARAVIIKFKLIGRYSHNKSNLGIKNRLQIQIPEGGFLNC